MAQNINNQIGSIVTNDLKRQESSLFLKIINSCHHQQIKTRLIMIMKLLNADFIVMGATSHEDKSNISVAYEIYSVNKQSKIRLQRIRHSKQIKTIITLY